MPADKVANKVVVVERCISLTLSSKNYVHKLFFETFIVDKHLCHMDARCVVAVDEDHDKLRLLRWSPTVHEGPYKSHLGLIKYMYYYSAVYTLKFWSCSAVGNDPRITSSIKAQSHTFMGVDHKTLLWLFSFFR